MVLILLYIYLTSLCVCEASVGDSSLYFQNCLDKCFKENCTESDINYEQPVAHQILQWSCKDECTYDCMWSTVDAFQRRNWQVPQFYGKWPFVRFIGIQEPASAIFSFFNLVANWKCLKRFRREVRADSPYYWMWHVFGAVALNCWFWSTVFHTRDVPFTEVMDYCSAFFMVLIMCYCMAMRVLGWAPKYVLVFISVIFMLFLYNHIAYLAQTQRINYTYNMQVNLFVGILTAITWFGWCAWNRFRLPYVWKCATFVALTGVFLLLEIIDIPPIFWVFDFHSLWHLSSFPTTFLFYNFLIDDCKHLRKQKFFYLGENLSQEPYKLLKKA